jgi:hypothetical protein
MNKAATPEPMPIPNSSPAIADLVIQDLERLSNTKLRREAYAHVIPDLLARKAFGIAKYGTPLQAKNGRNAGNDLYQELLDAAQYAKQLWLEQEGVPNYAIHSVYTKILELLSFWSVFQKP